MSTEGNGSISYSTKELLARIEVKIDNLDAKLDEKAEKASVEALKLQLELLKETAVRRDGPLMREYWEYTNETRRRLEAAEKEILVRAQYIPVVTGSKDRLDALEGRVTRMVGGIAALASVGLILATISAFRMWVGF